MELSSARSIIGELSWRNIYLVTQKYTGGGRRTRFIGSLWRKWFRRTKLFWRKNRFSSGEEIYRNRYRTRPWNFLVFLESLRIECRNGGQWSLTIIFTFYRDLRSVEDRSRIGRGSHSALVCGDSRIVGGRYSCFSFFEIEVSFNNNW